MKLDVYFVTSIVEIEDSWSRPDGFLVTASREDAEKAMEHKIFKPARNTWYQFGNTVAVTISKELENALKESERGFLYTDLSDEDFNRI